ncbi:heparin lyase I family protein [Pontibacter locisalis]|uniref:Heparin lyase I family protein n=1 Tax=Pontibacter locisalis TaxID=1719035 RepID=A0ABW5IQC1_9BACT
MNFKFRNLVMPLLIGAVAISCEKKELEELTPNQLSTSETSNLTTSANILFEETFEGSTLFSGLREQFGTSYAFSTANSPVYNGSKSGRFELRDTDPMVSNGTRTEVVFPAQSNQNRWYAFSVYFPSNGYEKDSKGDVISQWHQGGGKNPSISLRTVYDKLLLDFRTDPGTPQKEYLLNPIAKDVWHTFVMHINHSHGSDGVIEIWHNGVKVFTHKGGNSYDSTYESPRWKLGIYKSPWNESNTTDVSKRVLYFDEIRMGNERATLAEMTPRKGSTSTSTTTTTTTSKVTSLTLVNADTDQDIMELKQGATLNLASLPTKNLNIRANTGSDVSSVTFSLSGAQSKTVTENRKPFAMAGDDMRGNYYNWTPSIGSYTLKATPSVNGSASAALNVSFTVVNQTTSSISSQTSTTSQSAGILTNVGGLKFVDGNSRTWSADANFNTGETSSKSFDVAGTTNDPLYLSYRYASNGATINYNIPVSASGVYTIKLHFMEPYFKRSGERVSNINLETNQVLSNFDVYAEAGFGRALVKTFTNVSITDGKLDLDLYSVKNNAILSAVEIIKQ